MKNNLKKALINIIGFILFWGLFFLVISVTIDYFGPLDNQWEFVYISAIAFVFFGLLIRGMLSFRLTRQALTYINPNKEYQKEAKKIFHLCYKRIQSELEIEVRKAESKSQEQLEQLSGNLALFIAWYYLQISASRKGLPWWTDYQTGLRLELHEYETETLKFSAIETNLDNLLNSTSPMFAQEFASVVRRELLDKSAYSTIKRTCWERNIVSICKSIKRGFVE